MDDAGDGLQQSRAPAGGRPLGAPARWLRGQFVRVRGARWRVESSRPFPDCELLRLAGVGVENAGRVITLLSPFDSPRRVDTTGRLRRISWQAWMRVFARLVAAAAPCGRLRAAAAATIDLHAYQLEPALAVLNGHGTRFLLADEVGLGKTVQAGLIVAELLARDHATRTLILAPAGLRDQWICELRERFSIDATVMDASMVSKTVAQIPPGTNPWSVWPLVVASFDFVKRPEVLNAVAPFTWDTLVVDEAHQCVSAAERSVAVARLASRARHVILLTATPHAGDDRAFAALCDIGRSPAGTVGCDKAGDIVMFRRSRADVGLPRTRRVHLLRVRCSNAELRMHGLLARYTRAVWTSAVTTADARLAMIVLRKRALSSPHALVRSLERRRDALFEAACDLAQLALPFAGTASADEQTAEDDEPMDCLAAPGLDARREQQWLSRLIEAANAAGGNESKLRCLQGLLRRGREPAIVFTEYRDTARWLALELGTKRAVVLHGGLARAERAEVERRFRTGLADVLVATDAAGEGLNLHHRCRLVVNLELPWNPVRLEQRIGRVDRLGQTRRPHAIHLVGRATSEERIVERLVLRQQRTRGALGTVNDAVGATTEDDVARSVIAGQIQATVAAAPCPTADPPDARIHGFATIDLASLAVEEAERLRMMRMIMNARRRDLAAGRHTTSSEPIGAAVACLPHRRAPGALLSSALVCAFIVRIMTSDGDVIEESLIPLQVHLVDGKVLTRAGIEALNRSALLREAVRAATAARLQAAKAVHDRMVACALARERGLSGGVGQPAGAVQQGMFDRRAVRQAEHERQERHERAAEHQERMARLTAAMSSVPHAHVDVSLVLAPQGLC